MPQVAVIGAGAVGTAAASAAEQAGADVVICARSAIGGPVTLEENELLSGPITRLGRRHGVPTPANQAMYALVRALAPTAGGGG